MTERCPTCHGTGRVDSSDESTAALVEQLRAWLIERGHVVTPDDCTDTAGAAAARGVTAGFRATCADASTQ